MDCWSPEVQHQSGQHSETSSLPKNTKISQAWWYTPVVPAIQMAEVGRSPEPGEVKAAVSYNCVTALQPG